MEDRRARLAPLRIACAFSKWGTSELHRRAPSSHDLERFQTSD